MATATLPQRHGSIAKRATATATTVNTTAMSARFTISTPGEDRVGDTVRQEGIRLDNFKRNPIVMFDHGESGIKLPIGKSVLPNGALAVYRSAARTEADCYFSQSSLEAAQIFQLVEEGILSSASVRLHPLQASRRYASDGSMGLDIIESDLVEWSIVSVPCNAEACRKVLGRGKLAGRTIVEPIKKSLQSQVENYLAQGESETPLKRLERLEAIVASVAEAAGFLALPDAYGTGEAKDRLRMVNGVIDVLLEDIGRAITPPDAGAISALEQGVKELAALIDAFAAEKKRYAKRVAQPAAQRVNPHLARAFFQTYGRLF